MRCGRSRFRRSITTDASSWWATRTRSSCTGTRSRSSKAIASCPNCDYKANLEKASRSIDTYIIAGSELPAASEIATPSTTTIEALEASLKQPATAFLKALLLREAKGTLVAVVLPGDRDINEAKLRKVLGTTEVKFANEGDFAAAGSVPGFIGPVWLKV